MQIQKNNALTAKIAIYIDYQKVRIQQIYQEAIKSAYNLISTMNFQASNDDDFYEKEIAIEHIATGCSLSDEQDQDDIDIFNLSLQYDELISGSIPMSEDYITVENIYSEVDQGQMEYQDDNFLEVGNHYILENKANQQNYKKSDKNTNFPKLILKMLKLYFTKDAYDIIPKVYQLKDMKKIVRRYELNRKMKLDSIMSILQKGPGKNMQKYLTRQILHHILGKRKKNEIVNNQKIKKKILFLNTLKVYKLRCMNEKLCSRVRSR